MSAIQTATKRMPGRRKASVIAHSAHGLPTIRYLWKHDHGAEAIESLALVAAILALLAVISLAFRNNAMAIGNAITATLTRWLTQIPGATSVGSPNVIVAQYEMSLHRTVVGLPSLLVQTLDAALWVEPVIWIAGGLLTMTTAWRMAMLPVLPSAAGEWFRQVGDALHWTFVQVGGVFIGVFEGVYDMVAGLFTLAVDLGGLIVGDEVTRRKYAALFNALVRDPLGTITSVFGAIVEPIQADWQAGRYGEAIGRTAFEVLPAILALFSGGATAASYAGKAGSAGRAADALGDAGRVINRFDDVGRVVDKVDNAGSIAGRIDDVGDVAGTIAETGQRSARVIRTARHANDAAEAARRTGKVDDVVSTARMAELGWGHGSSEALRANLKAAGLQAPPFPNAAHHIVAHSDIRARPAQEHLARFGIHADDAVNGVFLRTGPRGEGVDHRVIHTDKYYHEVNRRVLSGATKEEVILILRDIADELRNGTFPY